MQIGFVGGGQMARALGRGFVEAGLVRGGDVRAFDPSREALQAFVEQVPGASAAAGNAEVAQASEVVLLAVKPQHLQAACGEIREHLDADKLVVSIAAGVTLRRLAGWLNHRRLVRVMPNTPCLVRTGASAFALAAEADEDDALTVEKLLGAVGVALRLDESLLDAVTGLSGSGPAFVYTMIEAMTDAGVRVGLPRTAAAALACQTVRGAAEMVVVEREHPAVLRDRVTSPGGTTIAGMAQLERHGFRAALIAAVEAATLRSKELGESD
ncbi:MAG: pyrroline-5-carboxylate reductase [Pirellulaceae bacterium]